MPGSSRFRNFFFQTLVGSTRQARNFGFVLRPIMLGFELQIYLRGIFDCIIAFGEVHCPFFEIRQRHLVTLNLIIGFWMRKYFASLIHIARSYPTWRNLPVG